jgi:hypothetical protein
MEKYLCWFAPRESYATYKTMIKRMVGLTSSSSNMHEIIDDNNNRYMSMIMDAMRMNQSYANACLIVDEESNAHAIKFFKLLKDYDEPLWDRCTNHSKLSVIIS